MSPKVLLNVFDLQSQGKLQNGPGYIRAGLEAGATDLLPPATVWKTGDVELESQLWDPRSVGASGSTKSASG